MLDRENFFVYDNEPRDARRAGLEPLRYRVHSTPESAPPPAGGGGVRVGCCTHSCFSDKAPPPGFVFFAHGSCAELRFIALAENRQTRTHACVSALAETGRLADAVILCLDTHQDHTPRRGQSSESADGQTQHRIEHGQLTAALELPLQLPHIVVLSRAAQAAADRT